MFRSALPHAQSLDIRTPLICYQGAMIRDPVSRETLFHRPLAQATALEVIRLLEAEGLHPNVYLDDNLYVGEFNAGTEFYAKMNGGLPINLVGDLVGFLRERGEPTKLSVVLGSEAEADAVVAELSAHFGDEIYATESHPMFAEALNPTCNKGVALAVLAAHLGIAQDETMAIGDGTNDLPMLGWAGLGVAMGQAKAEVRAGARHVTSAMAEDGLAAALHRFVLAS